MLRILKESAEGFPCRLTSRIIRVIIIRPVHDTEVHLAKTLIPDDPMLRETAYQFRRTKRPQKRAAVYPVKGKAPFTHQFSRCLGFRNAGRGQRNIRPALKKAPFVPFGFSVSYKIYFHLFLTTKNDTSFTGSG